MLHDVINLTPFRRRIAIFAALVIGCFVGTSLLTCSAVHAITPSEKAYNQAPKAKAALAIARRYLKQRRHSKAVNWANRAANCPDASGAIRAEASRIEFKLRWLLHDQGFGVVDIQLTPNNATVTLDGQLFRPAGRLVRVWLPNGSHQLEVKKTRYHTVRKIITAKAGETRSVSVSMAYAIPPQVTFVVQPPNAEVWLGRDFLGFSKGRTFSLPAGKSLIEVRAHGYVSWVRTLDMKAGDKRKWKLFLTKSGASTRSRAAASNIQRGLTPLELANRGERHRLGKRPGSGRASTKTFHGSGQAPDQPPPSANLPDWQKKGAPSSGAPAADAPTSTPINMDGIDDGNGAGVDAGVSTAPFSDAAKGWIYTGIGVALVAGGVGASAYGVSQAEYANGLSLGHSQYSSYYDNAANLTYAGYGSAGIGLISMVVGGMYLFSETGLSETERGLFVVGTGGVTAAAGAWLILNAVATAEAANALPMRHYTYNTNFDGAEANWLVGVVAAGVGSAVVIAGAVLLLTSDSGNIADSGAESWFARTQVLPTFGPGQAGASLTLSW